MKITLCSSAAFFDKLWKVKSELEQRSYEIFLPSMANYHNLHETAFAKIQHDLIKDHFKKISQSNAIYVANYDKNSIVGYIGGNCFLEMGKAFDIGIPIFLLKDVPYCSYREELLALQPIMIGEDWNGLDRIVKECCSKR